MITVVCRECRQVMLAGTEVNRNSQMFCIDCFRALYFKCEACSTYQLRGTMLSEDRLEGYNGVCNSEHTEVCCNCYSDNIVGCYSCHEHVHIDNSNGTELDNYLRCTSCQDDQIGYCDECEHDYYRMGRHGNSECPNCPDEIDESDDNDTSAYNEGDIFLASSRPYGIEIETVAEDGQLASRHRDNWEVTDDGSLPANGIEYVSPVLMGREGLVSLKKVTQALNDTGHVISKECGLHVHVSARGLTPTHLNKIGRTVYNWENLFYACLPDSRAAVVYCKKLGLDQVSTLDGISDPDTRYKGFNMQALAKHGTLEFRYHSGTMSYEKIARWIKLCLAVVKYGSRRKRHAKLRRCSNSHKNLMRLCKVLKFSDSDKRYWLKRYAHFNNLQVNTLLKLYKLDEVTA